MTITKEILLKTEFKDIGERSFKIFVGNSYVILQYIQKSQSMYWTCCANNKFIMYITDEVQTISDFNKLMKKMHINFKLK